MKTIQKANFTEDLSFEKKVRLVRNCLWNSVLGVYSNMICVIIHCTMPSQGYVHLHLSKLQLVIPAMLPLGIHVLCCCSIRGLRLMHLFKLFQDLNSHVVILCSAQYVYTWSIK